MIAGLSHNVDVTGEAGSAVAEVMWQPFEDE
jgi:hypothetical protein